VREIWASGIVTAVHDNSGNLIGFSKVMRDMTERNRLTEERDRFFTLSMDLLCIVRLDGRFQRVNPAFEKALGFSEEQLLTMSLFDLVHPEEQETTKSGHKKLPIGEPITSMEDRLRGSDGSYKWFAWSYYPIPENDLAFGLGATSHKSSKCTMSYDCARTNWRNRIASRTSFWPL
jgi:PAS domain S-box-containing protein